MVFSLNLGAPLGNLRILDILMQNMVLALVVELIYWLEAESENLLVILIVGLRA
jgi:hypothetical protein